MKKLISILTFSTLLISINNYGNENSLQLKTTTERCPHHIYIGPEIFLFDLNTHVKNIKIDGLKFFAGIRFRYEYLKPKALYAGVDLFSAVSNKGFHVTSHRYRFYKNNHVIGFGNFEFRLGYTAAYKNNMITPFLGIGAYSFGGGAYFSECMFYYAAGMRSVFELSQFFTMGLNWKVFHTDDTEQKIKFLLDGRKIKYTDRDNMWGGEIGVPFVWHIGSTKRWDVQLEPYFLKLDFSELQNIYGTRLLFGYRF